MFKSVEDLQAIGKSQVEAATASAAAMTRGVRQIAAETSAYAQRSVEDGSAATTRLLGAQSFDGAVQVQAEYATSAIDGMLAQASRISSLMLSVGKEAAKPFEAVMPFGFGRTGAR